MFFGKCRIQGRKEALFVRKEDILIYFHCILFLPDETGDTTIKTLRIN